MTAYRASEPVAEFLIQPAAQPSSILNGCLYRYFEVLIPSNLSIREMYAKFHAYICFLMDFSKNIPIPFIIPCIGMFVTSSS